jgi:hypothetical protein
VNHKTPEREEIQGREDMRALHACTAEMYSSDPMRLSPLRVKARIFRG